MTGLAMPAALDRRADEPKPFHHLPPDSGGWSVTQTRNFSIHHRVSADLAQRVARASEQARTAAFLRWFGEVRPPWQPRCEIYIYPSAASFHRATGVPETVPAVSTTRCDAGRVLSRRIELCHAAAHLLDAILPHEVTHIVLADHFGGSLPPWANEGIAVLVEPRARVQLHLRNLPYYRQQERLFSVGRLIQFRGYPSTQQMGPFYAQSASLVEFLMRQKGPESLVQFLRDAPSVGYETAIRRHYGCGFDELNGRWLHFAFAG